MRSYYGKWGVYSLLLVRRYCPYCLAVATTRAAALNLPKYKHASAAADAVFYLLHITPEEYLRGLFLISTCTNQVVY